MGKRRRAVLFSAAIAAAALSLSRAIARADTDTWSGGAETALGSDPANWGGGLPAGNQIFFGPDGARSAAGIVSNVVDTTTTIASLQYDYSFTATPDRF